MTFKVRLLLGAAAPLVFTLPAVAQVSISTATTAPVQTATANAGAASDVEITSAGSITLTTPNDTGVTVNSDNDVVNNGQIVVNNINGATGVRILPGFTGSYSGSGAISVLEDYTRTDTDADEDLDGPLAQGTGRVGLLVDAGGTFTGNLSLSTAATGTGVGSISVEGNNSFGVSVRSNLIGNYTQDGTITLTGSNGAAVDIRENVTGNIDIGGTTSAHGEGSVGVLIGGDVDGEFKIDGAVISTGFANREASDYEDPDSASDTDTFEPAQHDADDLLVGGSAVEIRGDLTRGFLIGGPAVGGVDPTDDVKDVIQDFNENRVTGSISTLGSAPAILVQSADGAAGDDIVLGLVRETILDTLDDDDDDNVTEVIGVFNYDYGFMNRGFVAANGTNMGFSSTGIRFAGSADGTHTTTIEGGFFNGRDSSADQSIATISARSFEADASGVVFGSGASTPRIVNNGTIRADVNTETNHDAYAVRIDAGANVGTITNNGTLFASVRGYDGDAVAFQDLSGTVTTFTNTSRIAAGYVDDDATDDIVSGLGRALAIDMSHSATGVVVTQADTIDNARIFGDILLGAGADQFNLLSGEVTGNVDFGGGADTFNNSSGKLFGDATFGGTNATVIFNDGVMGGSLALGNTTGSLAFSNNSIFSGEISRTGGGAMSLSVDNSILNNFAPTALNLSSMSFANNARIGLAVDNARVAGNIPLYNVSGAVDIAANTRFTPIFDQFTNQAFTLRVINGGTINLGGNLDDMLADDVPFLYNLQLVQPDPTAIDLVMSVKTAEALGLNTRQAGAYGAVLDLLEEDDTVAAAVTSLASANEFGRGWSDLLPSSDASVMRVLASNATAAFGATANRLDMISRKPNAPGGAWTEEFGVFHRSDTTADSVEISGGGFGVAAGVDLVSTGTALIGTYLSLESAELEEENRSGAPLNVSQTSIGAYGGWINGNLAINGTASYGFVDFTSDRTVEIGSLSDRLKAEWSGQSYTAAARATYTMPLGWVDLKPFVGADYIGFTQDGYSETATSTTNNGLAIVAGDSDASLATASYGLQLIGNLGADDAYSIRPELSVGYRSVLNWESNSADMRFTGGSTGTTFQLAPGVEPEDAIVAGLGLSVDSQFLNIKVGYDAEISDTAMTHYGSITLRMAFW